MKKIFIVIDNETLVTDLERFLIRLATQLSRDTNIISAQLRCEDTSVSFIDSFPKKYSKNVVSLNLNNQVLNGFSFAYGESLKKIKEFNNKLELEQDLLGKLDPDQEEIINIMKEHVKTYLFDFNCSSLEEVEKIIKTSENKDIENIILGINTDFKTSKFPVFNIKIKTISETSFNSLFSKIFN